MNPELGHLCLMLALALALAQVILPLLGVWRDNIALQAVAQSAAIGQSVFVTLAFLSLALALVNNDFSVAYVAAHSNSMLPWYYRFAALWGGHEGSLLLWVQILAGWTLAVSLRSRQLPLALRARVLAVLGMISVGFLLFVLLTSNPFERLLPAAADGRDLNPLLQDFGMIIHPPLLYMGYVGFAVAFAFAIAALLEGDLGTLRARWLRPWTLVAWSFLTLGIFMGSFWAYYELGWGGWWFWDAVENASFMPWLVSTALLHSLAVTEKRGSMKSWTLLLAIVAFSLSLLGTFLVRSGVLTSVHAFASDPRRGLFILIFLALVAGGSLALYAIRAPRLAAGPAYAVFSRESLILLNNVLLLTAAATVLLGTLYPLFLDALDLGKISVGPPYFETVLLPLMIPVLAVMGWAPLVGWRKAAARPVLRQVWRFAVVTVLLTFAAWFGAEFSSAVAGGLLLALWIVLATAAQFWQRVGQSAIQQGEAKRSGRLLMRFGAQPLGFWGMLVAHVGIAIFVAGVTLVKGGETVLDTSMQVGDRVQLQGRDYAFTALEKIDGANYIAARASFSVRDQHGGEILLQPEKRYYTVQQMPLTEAAIDRGFTRDLYVSLGEPTKSGAWAVRIQHKPFMGWIWAGCLTIAAGGLLAAGDRRYRTGAQESVSAAAVATTALASATIPLAHAQEQA